MKLLASILASALLPLGAIAAPLTLKTGDFMELRVRGPLNVEYVNNPDSAGLIEINGLHEEQLSWVEASGSGRKLTLQLVLPEGLPEVPTELPSAKVYSSYLTKVDNEGDSTVRVLTTTPVAQFSARVIGNGRIGVRTIKAGEVTGSILSGHGVLALTGECTKAMLKLTGTGVIQADGLQSKDATVWTTGTGSVGVWATKTLTIKGAGSGTVYVLGSPELKQKTIGVKVQPID